MKQGVLLVVTDHSRSRILLCRRTSDPADAPLAVPYRWHEPAEQEDVVLLALAAELDIPVERSQLKSRGTIYWTSGSGHLDAHLRVSACAFEGSLPITTATMTRIGRYKLTSLPVESMHADWMIGAVNGRFVNQRLPAPFPL